MSDSSTTTTTPDPSPATPAETSADGGFDRVYAIEVAAAVVLGLATVLGAYAAYQSSLWGGNCLTAYNAGTNKLGDANRELLRGVLERSFDTTIWIEEIKARDAEARREAAEEAAEAAAAEAPGAAAAAAPAAAEEEEEEAEASTPEGRAEELLDDATYSDDMTIAKKMAKLKSTRRELEAAIKWADKTHEKRIGGMKKEAAVALAKTILDLEAQQEKIDEEAMKLVTAAGLDADADEEDIEAALEENPDAAAKYVELEGKWDDLQASIEKEYDKLSRPMFFESPEYARTRERKYKKLLDEGNKMITDGQQFNQNGDKFTLTTVLFTVTLFFAGMSSVLRRMGIKIAFLAFSVAMLAYTLIQMMGTPFA